MLVMNFCSWWNLRLLNYFIVDEMVNNTKVRGNESKFRKHFVRNKMPTGKYLTHSDYRLTH